MGVLECHHLTPPNEMVELKTHELWCHQILYVLTLIGKQTYIYPLTLNKKWKMKITGRVAWLILLVVVSVYVVFCVLCCRQNNPMFLSVTISHMLKNENYELCFLARFFANQTTTGKNYNRKKKVQSSGRWLEQISDNRLLCQNTNTNYHRKKLRPEKKVQLSGHWLE